MLPLIADEMQGKIAAMQRKHPGVPLDTLIVLVETNDSHAAIQSELNRIGLAFLAFEAHLIQIQAQFEELVSFATTHTTPPQKTRRKAQQKQTDPRHRLSSGVGRRQGIA